MLEGPADVDDVIEEANLIGGRERTVRDVVRTMDEADLASLYTPIGLDLGGGSTYQIAHSIVGEVLAVDNDRTPHHLREREGHIHDRVDVDARPETDVPSR